MRPLLAGLPSAHTRLYGGGQRMPQPRLATVM